jgi:hypothetical protein
MQPPYNPPPLPDPGGDLPFDGRTSVNNSGLGPASVLPPELQGVNVGAFFMSWIWAIAHNYWLGLLVFVPCVGIVMQFVLLFKGNEFAWQNRKWDSIEQFKEVQRKWMLWGIGLTLLGCVAYGIMFAGLAATGALNPQSGAPGTQFSTPPVR